MSENANEKKIQISGTVTRYQMKKVIKKPEDVKERKTMEQVSLEMFSWENQYSLLNMLSRKTNDDPSVILVKKQILSKLNNYKQQDVIKKVYDERKLIHLDQVNWLAPELLPAGYGVQGSCRNSDGKYPSSGSSEGRHNQEGGAGQGNAADAGVGGNAGGGGCGEAGEGPLPVVLASSPSPSRAGWW